jgi:hypothetical protein
LLGCFVGPEGRHSPPGRTGSWEQVNRVDGRLGIRLSSSSDNDPLRVQCSEDVPSLAGGAARSQDIAVQMRHQAENRHRRGQYQLLWSHGAGCGVVQSSHHSRPRCRSVWVMPYQQHTPVRPHRHLHVGLVSRRGFVDLEFADDTEIAAVPRSIVTVSAVPALSRMAQVVSVCAPPA